MSIVRHNDVQDMDLTRGKASRAGFDNRNENSRPIQNSNSTQEERANAKRLKEFRELVEELPSCDLDKLRRLAWGGVPMGNATVILKELIRVVRYASGSVEDLAGVFTVKSSEERSDTTEEEGGVWEYQTVPYR